MGEFVRAVPPRKGHPTACRPPAGTEQGVGVLGDRREEVVCRGWPWVPGLGMHLCWGSLAAVGVWRRVRLGLGEPLSGLSLETWAGVAPRSPRACETRDV